MPKGQLKVKGKLKLKGSSRCNILISEMDASCMKLPRPADSNGLIAFKLKHKNKYWTVILN